jgi:Bacterial Ig-like domain (group 2)/Putative Ig domain/Beta-propeller repeat
VATINATGLATAVGTGTSTISATSGSISGSTVLTVTPATLVSIAVTPANPSITKGATQQFTATGTFSDSSTQVLTSVVWASGTTTVATINATGLATAVGTGTSTISATSGSISGSTVLTVTPAPASSFAIATPGTIPVGVAFSFTVTAKDAFNNTVTGYSGTVSFSSSASSYVLPANTTLTNGTGTFSATLYAQGSQTITARDTGNATIMGSSDAITVTAAVLQSISVTPASASTGQGQTQQFFATGILSDGTTQDLTASATWTSSLTTVATIGVNTGLATGAGVGSTNITAMQNGVTSNTAVLTVIVVLNSIAVAPTSASIAPGLTQQFTATGLYSDGTTQDLTPVANWLSSPSVATIGVHTGLATGVAAGSTYITATQNGVTSNAVVLSVSAVGSGYENLAVPSQRAPSVAVDPSGNVYLAAQMPQNFSDSMFRVDKFDSSGNEVSPFPIINLGGGQTVATGIAADPQGNAYVTGYTDDPNLGIGGASQAFVPGSSNAFVIRINGATGGTDYFTYLGPAVVYQIDGSQQLQPAIAVDRAANAYVTGTTGSGFPTTTGLPFGGGNSDAFVVKLNPLGGVVYSTFLGGSNDDGGGSIAVDDAGNAYVTGLTYSPDFPVSSTAVVQPTCPQCHQPPGNRFDPGYATAFVTKLNSSVGSITYSTYLGIPRYGYGIAADAAGNAYLAGAFNGVSKLSADASQLVYSTSLPGQTTFYPSFSGVPSGGPDFNPAIAANAAGEVWVAGIYEDGTSLFAKLNAAGTMWVRGSADPIAPGSPLYLNAREQHRGIAVDPSGNAYVTGEFQTSGSSTQQAFLLKILDVNTPAGTNVSVSPMDTTTGLSPVSLTFSNVTQAGITTLATSTVGPTPPTGFLLGSVYYNLATTVQFTGNITICITSSAVTNTSQLWHFASTGPVNVTSSVMGTSICGTVSSLSPFAILQSTVALTSVAVTPTNPSIPNGATLQFTATGTYSDSTTQDLTASATWTSSITTVATISNTGLASAVGAGTSTISATSGSVSGTTLLTVTPATQIITFPKPPDTALTAGSVTLTATASSGLTVSYTSMTLPVCTVLNSSVTLVSTGTCSITANQAGNANFAAAAPVSNSFQVLQDTQTITFPQPPDTALTAGPVTLTATASSGLAVSYASATLPVCTVSGSSATLVSVGTCSIAANQTGNTNFAAAAPVNQSFRVLQGTQTINFPAIPNHVLGDAPFGIGATATSGLPVSFASTTSAVCSVSGGTVTLIHSGQCSIQATQAGNATFAPAPPVTQSFQVAPATLVSIAVTPANSSITKGTTQQFTATGHYSDGTTQDLTASATWSSSLATVVTINAMGLATAVGTGTSMISATSGSISGSTLLTVNQAPAITSANNTTFQRGVAGNFTVTSMGFPAPSIIETGALPGGVTFVDNHNGTGTLSGTPAVGGVFSIIFTASNGVGTNAVQIFTLTVPVSTAPVFTSPNSATFTVGTAGSFTVTATGFPTPTLSRTGALPSGVTFDAETGVLSGTPAAGAGRIHNITFTARNGVAPNAVQNFTLTVLQAPAITSAASATFTVGTARSFTVKATGFPAPTLNELGPLPSGVTFNPATGVLSGTPEESAGGTYNISFGASNGAGADAVQNFTLTVREDPAFTSANSVTFTVGTAGSFTVTAVGFPTPTLSIKGALPTGVTFNEATGVLSGTPAAGTGRTYNITFTARNGVAPNAVQGFTLTVK